jgi:MFS family permease
MALLVSMQSPSWMPPLLKFFFAVSYVLLAAFVGAFADALPKGKVMFITNMIKVLGCALMFFHVHPLIAYALVGFGAAAYSPAKYGILTELLPRKIGRCKWLDRRLNSDLHHSRHRTWWCAGHSSYLGDLAEF